MTNTTKHFIIIDDDPFSNLLSKTIIIKLVEDAEVKDFLIPEIALTYIKTEFEYQQLSLKITLFLDINMPTLSGWQFLEQFKTFPQYIQKQFDIYMLSSSIDPADIQRAKQNSLVIDFVEKPLNKTVLKDILL